ncbi:uncharacterized protein PRCAT00005226001 [Priceomyces carsonii]|uniref:uncharacterized protein n=1 Tax=Priceomyces carsonii TaxID=28549 RepID=UPI002ED99600|nr:unnamed protein product [Priceomyces carsonii]
MPSLQEGASTTSSSISLIKTIIGAGMLSMPLAYSTDGIIFGTFIILLAAATSGFGLFLQAYTAAYVPKGNASFFNLCCITYPLLSVLFDIAIAIQCFGCAISYLVLVGDIMTKIVKDVPFIPESSYKIFWTLSSAVLCVPLSFMKNLDSLRYTSILGLIAIGYVLMLTVGHFIAGDIQRDDKSKLALFPPNATGVFSTISIIVLAFTGHQNMFSIINEAKDKTLISLTKLIVLAIAVSSGLFIIVGLSGYLTFGDHVNANIVLLYPNSFTATLGRLAIIFMVIFSFPLMLHPARISVNNIVFWCRTQLQRKLYQEPERAPLTQESDIEQNNEHHQKVAYVIPLSERSFNVITISLLFLGYFLAITVKSFAFILAIVGATGSTSISFTLPGLFGYKLIGSELTELSTLESTFKYLSLFLVIWGLVVMMTCLYASLFLS